VIVEPSGWKASSQFSWELCENAVENADGLPRAPVSRAE
jgi:hypothetical protein